MPSLSSLFFALFCTVCFITCLYSDDSGNLIQLETKELSLCDMSTFLKNFKQTKGSHCTTHKCCIIPFVLFAPVVEQSFLFLSSFHFSKFIQRFCFQRKKPGCALGSACMGCLMSTEAVGRRATIAAISAASEPCSSMARGAAG